MPVEIGTSGGLTFRVTDSDDNVKFDINRRQAKVVLTAFIGTGNNFFGDADANVIGHRTGQGGTHSTIQYHQTAVVQHVEARYLYLNIDPTDGFILPFIYFPNSGSDDNSNIVYATSSNANYNARVNREAMFIHPLGKWIPANGGKIIRHYFTQNNFGYRGWSGTQLFFYHWRTNPHFGVSGHPYTDKKYRIATGIITQCNSVVGYRDTGGSHSIDAFVGYPPAIYNMSGIGYNDIGTGTGKMKSTRCYMSVRFFICK